MSGEGKIHLSELQKMELSQTVAKKIKTSSSS
jgi:hypothetical protein